MKRALVCCFILGIIPWAHSETRHDSQYPGLAFTVLTRDSITPPPSIRDIRKNGIYLQNVAIFPAAFYERTLPLTEGAAMNIRCGATSYGQLIPMVGASIIVGGPVNFLEFGGTALFVTGPEGLLEINYRRVGRKGFLLKGGFMATHGLFSPLLGLGYAF